MSIDNYERMKQIGVTGDDHVNCFVAAIDAVSPNYHIHPRVYAGYTEAFNRQEKDGINTKMTRDTIKWVLDHAGGSSKGKISERRITQPYECKEVLEKARMGNRRIIVYTESHHVVGLVPVNEDKWMFVGNEIPTSPVDPISSEEVFFFLAQPSRFKRRPSGKPIKRANIITLSNS